MLLTSRTKTLLLVCLLSLILSLNLREVSSSSAVPPPVAPEPGVVFVLPINGTGVTLTPEQMMVLMTPDGVSINLTANAWVNITVTESNMPIRFDRNLTDDVFGVGLFVDIKLNTSTVDFNATLGMPYNSSSLPANVSEKDLYLAFFNETSASWEGVQSWVDTNEEKVYANTTHFSTWTILTNVQAPLTDTGPVVSNPAQTSSTTPPIVTNTELTPEQPQPIPDDSSDENKIQTQNTAQQQDLPLNTDGFGSISFILGVLASIIILKLRTGKE